MENPVIIFGANHVGRAAKEIFDSNDVVVYGFLDDKEDLHDTVLDGVSILGSTDDDGFLKLIGKKCEAFVATDDNKLRKSLVKMLHDIRHVQPVNAIHHTASLASSAQLGHGNFIDAGVRLAAGAAIGHQCLLHANAFVGVGSVIGDFVQVGSGAIINAEVTVEDEVFIGTGAVIVSGVSLGKGARIGAGSVVISSVAAGETVFGNPAQKVKP